MRRDLVYRDEIMDSLVKEYNRKRTNDGLKLAWIEKAVNDVKPAQIDLPDNNVGELISRKQVIDALEKWLHSLFGITEADGTATIFKTIRQLPPIQPERKECEEREQGKCPWYAG